MKKYLVIGALLLYSKSLCCRYIVAFRCTYICAWYCSINSADYFITDNTYSVAEYSEQ